MGNECNLRMPAGKVWARRRIEWSNLVVRRGGRRSLIGETDPRFENAMTANEAPVLTRIRRWLAQAQPAGDAELVRRFAEARDQDAFAALVDRHGPMVLGVARRVTGNHHAAEDVLQAAFLSLARRAAGIRRPGGVAAWLHRTAHHLSLTAVRSRERRE